MDATVQNVQSMLNNMVAEDLCLAMRYIQSLLDKRRAKTKVMADNAEIFDELQELFKDDKGGYESEEDVIRDLAEFRRERMNHANHAGY